jgi:hypothetical protein
MSTRQLIKIRSTFFQGSEWPMGDHTSPLDSWSLPQVLDTHVGETSNDVHAKLYHHVQSNLRQFCRRLASLGVDFDLCRVPMVDVPRMFPEKRFARIEASATDLSGCDRKAYNSCRPPIAPMPDIRAYDRR